MLILPCENLQSIVNEEQWRTNDAPVPKASSVWSRTLSNGLPTELQPANTWSLETCLALRKCRSFYEHFRRWVFVFVSIRTKNQTTLNDILHIFFHSINSKMSGGVIIDFLSNFNFTIFWFNMNMDWKQNVFMLFRSLFCGDISQGEYGLRFWSN